MAVFLIVVCIVVLIGLILVAGVQPLSSDITTHELMRRKATGDKKAANTLRREALLPSIRAMQQSVVALLLVGLGYLLVVTFGWLWGSLAMLLVVFGYGSVARLGAIRRISRQLYSRYEPALLRAATHYKNSILRLVQNAEASTSTESKVDSREELQHLIESTDVLSHQDKTFLLHALQFDTRCVHEIMTSKRDVKTVPKKELLGPLVLDDLHKTGYEAFPVVDGDAIVGILSIEQLLTVDSGKKSTTAEKAMDERVTFIETDRSLRELLVLFATSHVRMVVVKKADNEIAGIVTLSDLTQALIGK